MKESNKRKQGIIAPAEGDEQGNAMKILAVEKKDI